jgi:hypothetical protein
MRLLMDPEHQPLDPIVAAGLVARAIDEIDHSGEEEREMLLSAFVCAAWGNICSLNQ